MLETTWILTSLLAFYTLNYIVQTFDISTSILPPRIMSREISCDENIVNIRMCFLDITKHRMVGPYRQIALVIAQFSCRSKGNTGRHMEVMIRTATNWIATCRIRSNLSSNEIEILELCKTNNIKNYHNTSDVLCSRFINCSTL